MLNSTAERIATALESIALDLRGLLESTNPLNQVSSLSDLPEEELKVRALYTDERAEIVREHLLKMGKEPK